jgi:hypothetical protein
LPTVSLFLIPCLGPTLSVRPRASGIPLTPCFPQKVCQLVSWHLSNRGATDRLPFSIPRVQRKETDCLDRSRKCPRNVAVKECRASFDTFSPMLLTSPHLDALSRQTLRTALVDGCCCCWLIAPCVVNGTVDLEYNSLLFESV